MGATETSGSITVTPREGKSKVVHARFSTLEMERVTSAAAAAGLTVSGFMRSLVLEGAGVRPFFIDADRAILDVLHSEVRALGINFNQLARAVNRGWPASAEDVRALAGDVQLTLAAVLIELQFYAARGARIRRGDG